MDVASFCVPLLAGDFADEMQDAIDRFGAQHGDVQDLRAFALYFLNGEYLTGDEDMWTDEDEAERLRHEARQDFARMCADAGMAVQRLRCSPASPGRDDADEHAPHEYRFKSVCVSYV